MKTFIVHVLGLRGAAAQRSLCPEPLLYVGRPRIDTVKESKFTTQRWKGGGDFTNALHCCASLSFIRGKKVPSLCFILLHISRESGREQNTQCWCYSASFQCSLMHPNQNLHLWLVNHWRQSCRVCVCRQTGQRICSSLFKRWKKNEIYICLYVCVHGSKLWQLTVYLYAFVWGVLFLRG